MVYRAEIDGLRAIAVLPVVFFHAGFDVFKGGYKKCIFKGYVDCPVDFSESKGEAHSLINEFQDFANKNKRGVFINPYEAVCESNRCKVIEDNRLLYSDHAHLSKYGATLVVNKYKLMILDFIKRD